MWYSRCDMLCRGGRGEGTSCREAWKKIGRETSSFAYCGGVYVPQLDGGRMQRTALLQDTAQCRAVQCSAAWACASDLSRGGGAVRVVLGWEPTTLVSACTANCRWRPIRQRQARMLPS